MLIYLVYSIVVNLCYGASSKEQGPSCLLLFIMLQIPIALIDLERRRLLLVFC